MTKSISLAFRAAAKATAEETRKELVSLAKREHAKVMQTEPKPSRFIRSVDGKVGAREEVVKPGGIIVYHYARLDEVVQVAMELLFDLSPVLSGDYRHGHTLFVDGVQARNLADWDGRGEIMISNMLPYSRKIEAGKMTMRVKGTDHVYEQAEFLLRKRFGNQARIKFMYRGIVGGGMVSQIGHSSPPKRGKNGRFVENGGTREHNKSQNRFPALEIEALK